jgi:FMN phosphatase YigB (HAD superfamily)
VIVIKVLCFGLVDVLVKKKDLNLKEEETNLESLFYNNKTDADFILKARNIIPKDVLLIRATENLINNIYEVKDKDLFSKIKEKYPDIKIIIATNHVSYVRNYIGEAFGVTNLDGIFISAEIHKTKPNQDFYEYIIKKLNVEPHEILFFEAKDINLPKFNIIKVNKNDDLFNLVLKSIKENQH